jgi:hypothetical protein
MCLPALVYSAVISGTVKDPSGGLVPQATIQISGAALAQPLVITADGQGHFATLDLAPGGYTIRATAPAFNLLSRTVQVGESGLTLELQLALATAVQEVTVAGKARQFANNVPCTGSCARWGWAPRSASRISRLKTTQAIFF